MAALVAGVQYGLSSHINFPENKSYIFVKLTDSAQRAIDDLIRNRNKINQNPTIQFLGSEGHLSVPSTQSSHGSSVFTFSITDDQDNEGSAQGGFECIQQSGQKSLESLGTLPCKMRVHANDDVYETTRHRMAVAEENNKNKCTRVIKANGPDIGRKVKVKATGRTIPPPITNVRHRESASIPTSTNQSSRSQPSAPPAAPSTTSSSSSFSSYKPIQHSNQPPTRAQPDKKVSDVMRRPLRERLIHLLALRPYKRPELYNRITTEGIKERDRSTTNTVLKQVAYMRDNTYHLLRHVWNDVQEDWPFYTEQEKAMLKRRKPQNLTPPGSSDGGSSGSGQSPNSTHAGSPPAITAPPPGLMNLKRPGYYQSADGLQTKKPRISHFRKSDTNTTTGSGNSMGNRELARTTANNSSGGGYNGRVTSPPASGKSASALSGSGVGSVGSENNGWEQRAQRHQQQQQQQQSQHHQQHHQQHQQQQQQQQQHQQQRDRADYRAERTTNSDVLRSGSYNSAKLCLTPTSDSEDINQSGLGHNNHHSNAIATSGSAGANLGSSGGARGVNNSGNHFGSSNHHSNSSLSYNNNPTSNHHHSVSDNSRNVAIGGESNSVGYNGGGSLGGVHFVRSSTGSIGNSLGSSTGSPSGSSVERRDRERDRGTEREYERDRESGENISAPGTNSYNDFLNPGASGINANAVGAISSPPAFDVGIGGNSEDAEIPDYLVSYTTISSEEQRRRYKDEFAFHYEEYKTLHAAVGRVSEQFDILKLQMRREQEMGNTEASEAIKRQIFQAYLNARTDVKHSENKKRFDYLHKKLSHIKQLVYEYDTGDYSGNGFAGDWVVINDGGTDVLLRTGLRN